MGHTQELEKIILHMPTSFSEVKLPERDIEARRKALNEQNGKMALVLDGHRDILCMGRVRVDTNDAQCYYLGRIYSDYQITEERLHYDDLVQLFRGVGIGLRQEFSLENT